MSLPFLLAELLHYKVFLSRQWKNLFGSEELYWSPCSQLKNHLDQASRDAENSTTLLGVMRVQQDESIRKRLPNTQLKLTHSNTFNTKYSNLKSYTFSTAVLELRNSSMFPQFIS